MDKKKLASLLSPETKKILSDNFSGAVELFYLVASDLFEENRLYLLEELLKEEGFQKFLTRRKSSSPGRLEGVLKTILRRCLLEIPPSTLSQIANSMSSKEYRQMESVFYVVPIDKEGYEVFERGFFAVGEQKPELLSDYLSYCSSDRWFLLRTNYKPIEEVFQDLANKLVNYFLAARNINDTMEMTKYFLDPVVYRFIFTSVNESAWKEFTMELFGAFQNLKNPLFFLQLLRLVSTRYPEKTISAKSSYEREIFKRLLSLWEVMKILPEDKLKEFKQFLQNYGNPKNEMQSFVWDATLSLNKYKIPQIFTILNSPPFLAIRDYYGEDAATQKFLIKNIINAVAEMEFKKFETKLYKVVLRLLLTLKVDRSFVKRRSVFFDWLKKETNSQRVELEFMRFTFYEYIFISLGQVKNERGMKMTRYCDDDHAYICKYLDEIPLAAKGRLKDITLIHNPVLERLRFIIHLPFYAKFTEYEFGLKELESAAISIKMEDNLYTALETISKENFIPYYESFMEVFKTAPERMNEAILPDYWYRISLEIASPHAHAVVLPLVGSISILEGDLGAYTDGKSIFLPPFISYFSDPLHPIEQNRNLTIYIALALHECGHIIGGSFKFDLSYYLSKLEKPSLFRIIMNAMEDFRIESFLVKIKAHPQIEELLHTMNEYFTFMNLRNPENLAMNLVFYIMDEAAGNNDLAKSQASYQKSISELMNSGLYSGRFSNLKDMVDYFITRLKSIDIGNPLSAYPVSRELYEILKYWPDTALASLASPEYFPTGLHSFESENGEGQRPLNQEELDALYKEYNENPRAFLERNKLPVFSELMEDEEGLAISQGLTDKIQQYKEDILREQLGEQYSQAGTIDLSHRTKADDLIAENQKRKKDKGKSKDSDSDLDEDDEPQKKEGKKKNPKPRTKRIYSIDPKTKSRTRLTELKEFRVRDIDSFYMKKFRKWQYISQQVLRELSALLPTVQEMQDTSSFEGELNMELLIEILSDPSRIGSVEFLDIFRENTRSVEIIIGLDISGSTDMLIQPINKTGTPKMVNGMPVIMLDLTPKEMMQYDTILDIEKAFAMIFAQALSYITKNVNIYAFNSATSTNIYKAETIESVSSFVSDSANRDGDFIRYIHSTLLESNAEMKYFYLITDGRPSADNYSGKDALDDTLIAMREVINSGIKLIYFNIDSQKQDYFDLFQKEATFARHFQSPEDLLPVIPELVRTVVQSVS